MKRDSLSRRRSLVDTSLLITCNPTLQQDVTTLYAVVLVDLFLVLLLHH